MTYAIFIFFSSLIFIFRTGEQPAYAYIIIVQLFLIPIPFLQLLSKNFGEITNKHGIRSPSWLYENIPLMSFISIFDLKRKEELSKLRYLASLETEILPEDIDRRIQIKKELLLDKQSPAHKLVLHYYELIVSYSASFDDDKFIYIPTPSQLNQWWMNRTDRKHSKLNIKFIEFTDQVLWDPVYIPEQDEIMRCERTGQTMVLAIQ